MIHKKGVSSLKNLGVVMSIFFFLISGIVFKQALSMEYYSEFGPGSALLPLWISGFMMILCVINIIMSLKKNIIHFSDVMPKGEGLVNVLTCVGSLALFMLIVPYAGFTISCLLMLFILFSRGYKWYWGLGLSTVVTGLLFWIFSSILSIPLPVNAFGW